MTRLLALAAIVWLCVPRPAAAAPCELRGSPARAQIRVHVSGHANLALELTDLEVVARFGRTTKVETLGPLHVSGAAVQLPLTLAKPVVADAGRITLSTGVLVLRARASGDRLRLTVAIAPRSSIGARISPVLVACADVRLGAAAKPATKVGPDSAVAWFSRPRLLELRDRPEGDRRTNVRANERLALPLEEVERRRDWVHVRAAWTDGSAVAGWAPRAQLSPAPSGLLGWGSYGEIGTFSCTRSSAPARANGYVGPATLRAGAGLHVAPARGRWAEAREDVAVQVEIADMNRDEWVQVVVIPGVAESCGRLDHAWVPRDQVVLSSPPPSPSPVVDPPTAGARSAERHGLAAVV